MNKENYLICSKGHDNYIQSKYCAYCGEKEAFSEEERNKAFKKTPFSKLQDGLHIFNDAKKIMSFADSPSEYYKKEITNKMPIKVALIVIFIVLGSYMYITNKPLWNRLTILPSSDYYLSKNKEMYHISTSKETINLKLGTIKDIDTAEVSLIDKNDHTNIGTGEALKVIKDKEYVLNVTYTDGSNETLKFVFNK